MKSPSQTKRHGQVTYAVALPHCAPVDRPGDHRTNPSHCNTQKASLPRPSPHAKPETFSRKIAGKAMKTMQSSPHVSLNLNADRRPQLSGLGSKSFDRRVNQKAGDGALHCRRPFFVFYALFCWVKRIPANSLPSLPAAKQRHSVFPIRPRLCALSARTLATLCLCDLRLM